MSKRNFKVTITERLKRTVEVEADDLQEAKQMVHSNGTMKKRPIRVGFSGSGTFQI